MANTTCTLCGFEFPSSDLNKHGECVECIDNAGHLQSEGWDPF